MHENTEFTLSRDVEAIQIPSGVKTTIPEGTPGVITQTLGGSYTIATYQGLARVAEKDLDALGLEKPTANGAEKPASTSAGEVDEKMVWDQLKQCFDPEIPVNIVDLGLVYDMVIEPLPIGNSTVLVKMNLTAPGCGMGGVIAGDAQQKLFDLPGVEEAQVEIVWDPPWHQSMITPAGRSILGLE